MNIHLAGNPVEAHAFVEVQGGETPTSLVFPHTLPSHLSLLTLATYLGPKPIGVVLFLLL